MKVSYSKVSTYMSCPYQYYLSYILNLRLKKPSRPLFFGGDFHKLLQHRHDKEALRQAYSQIKETYNDMPVQFQEDLGDTYLDDLKTIFSDYQKVWKGTDKPLKTEYEFKIDLGDIAGETVIFHGIIDEVYEDKIGEHKTFNNAPNMSTLAMNTQVCLYAKALELETGQRVERVQWDYIKSTPAKYPTWLEKSKRFSEAASNQITPFSWLRACKERGIEDLDVLSKAKQYEPNISNFFFRCTTELIPSMVNTVWSDFNKVVIDMVIRGDSNKVKHITRDCGWCDFRPICYGEFTGADVEYIKATDYIIKEDKNEPEIDESNSGV